MGVSKKYISHYNIKTTGNFSSNVSTFEVLTMGEVECSLDLNHDDFALLFTCISVFSKFSSTFLRQFFQIVWYRVLLQVSIEQCLCIRITKQAIKVRKNKKK